MSKKKSSPLPILEPPVSLLRHLGSFQWQGVPRQQYKESGPHWQDVSRTELIALPKRDELPFHVRYFEIGPGGFSSKERHAHEHVVIVVRGTGTVELEGKSKRITVGDIVHVQSWNLHQFRQTGGSEPLGFDCIVAAERDRPVVEGAGPSSCELPIRNVKKREPAKPRKRKPTLKKSGRSSR